MGSSAVIARTLAELTRRSPEALREMLWSDEWLGVALEGFHARLVAHKRDAIRQYFESIELIAGKNDRAVSIWLAGVGVENAELARDMLEMARRAMDSKDDDAYKLAKDLIRARVQADPGERRRVMQELFGMMDATPMDALPMAVNGHAANGNGHRNGGHK